MKKSKIHLISNMYPSPKNIRYGIFVKNFVKSLEHHFEINRIVLTKKNGLQKLIGYIFLYLKISSLL